MITKIAMVKIGTFLKHFPRLRLLVKELYYPFKKLRISRNCDIAELDYLLSQGTLFRHPIGIVTTRHFKIGTNCEIFQNVTIGRKRESFPVLGNNVKVFPSSCILGKAVIGNNSIIGAGSIVVDQVIPEDEVWAGNPAKFIRKIRKYKMAIEVFP